MNISDWKKPKDVRTPNIEEDIKNLLSEDVLKAYHNCNDEKKKSLVNRVVELFDFVDHLMHFRNYLEKINKPEFSELIPFEIDGKMFFEAVKKDNIQFEGHDYSGCGFDIEALVFYLYVSMIETATDKNFVKLDKYFTEKLPEELMSKEEILEFYSTYQNKYGLSKNFREVFTDRISNGLKKEFIDNIFVLGGRKEDYKKEDIDEKWKNWAKLEDTKKLQKIATNIYNIRSSYTHSSVRYFLPTVPCDENIPVECNTVYLLRKGADILEMLKQVIIELCIEDLSKSDNKESKKQG